MRRLIISLVTLVLTLTLGASGALACSAVSNSVALDVFECNCEENGQPILAPIFVVSGTTVVTNRRAAPTLGSIVVELQARLTSTYEPVATLVLNESDTGQAETCRGTFVSGPAPGKLTLTDANGFEVSFTDVKDLPEGRAQLNWLATFSGPIPGVELGERVRIRVYTTAFGVDSSLTCDVDADDDGGIESQTKTIRFQRTIRVPTSANLLVPPTP